MMQLPNNTMVIWIKCVVAGEHLKPNTSGPKDQSLEALLQHYCLKKTEIMLPWGNKKNVVLVINEIKSEFNQPNVFLHIFMNIFLYFFLSYFNLNIY